MAERAGNAASSQALLDENSVLRLRLQELEDTLHSIHSGDVDALVVNGDIYTIEAAHAAAHRLRQDVLSQMQDAVFAFDLEDNLIFLNSAAERRYGVEADAVLGRHRSEVFTETLLPEPGEPIPSVQRATTEATHRLPGGQAMRVEFITSALRDASGRIVGSLAVIRDITQRHREQSRREALARLNDDLRDLDDPAEIGRRGAALVAQMLGTTHAAYACVDAGGTGLVVIGAWSDAAQAAASPLALDDLGWALEPLRTGHDIGVVDVRTDRGRPALRLPPALGAAWLLVPLIERGHLVAVLHVSSAQPRPWSADELGFAREVAERIRMAADRARAEAARRDSEVRLREAYENLEQTVALRTRELMTAEEALRQAQKMEAVGQLTGGIAHDFNNLLAGISASLQVLHKRLKAGKTQDVDRYLSMGQESVRRAASLTQRLLAFARRQTLDPRPTDVNHLVAGMTDLVRRTVGPAVEVQVDADEGLWPSRLDPSQLENSLLNLCINARDAMQPAGGRLRLTTRNVQLAGTDAAALELPAGDYVSVAVSDTGVGMTPEIVKRVFDPFFTTKPLGQGTGLGLSMVYGFVRQSGGQVKVQSAPGQGTTMALYMPRFHGRIEPDLAPPLPADAGAGQGERVLLIEDERTIRVLVAETLEECGYAVLTVADGPAGMQILNSSRAVSLLITDVGLPGGMNGRQIADAARVHRPDLKVLFITGYAENAAVGNGLLEPGMGVMTKPIDMTALAQRVRQMLDS